MCHLGRAQPHQLQTDSRACVSDRRTTGQETKTKERENERREDRNKKRPEEERETHRRELWNGWCRTTASSVSRKRSKCADRSRRGYLWKLNLCAANAADAKGIPLADISADRETIRWPPAGASSPAKAGSGVWNKERSGGKGGSRLATKSSAHVSITEWTSFSSCNHKHSSCNHARVKRSSWFSRRVTDATTATNADLRGLTRTRESAMA